LQSCCSHGNCCPYSFYSNPFQKFGRIIHRSTH
jgi:hypothetical protein